MGRLKPGVTLQQANANMDSVTRHIAEVYPKSNKGWSAARRAPQERLISRDRSNLFLATVPRAEGDCKRWTQAINKIEADGGPFSSQIF